jgi:hypothetical protein
VSELYRPSDRCLSAKLVPTFVDRRVSRGRHSRSLRPYSRVSRPEPLLFLPSSSSLVLTRLSGLVRKSASARNRTRNHWICNQGLWPLDHRGGQCQWWDDNLMWSSQWLEKESEVLRGSLPQQYVVLTCDWTYAAFYKYYKSESLRHLRFSWQWVLTRVTNPWQVKFPACHCWPVHMTCFCHGISMYVYKGQVCMYVCM